MKHHKKLWPLTGILLAIGVARASEIEWRSFTGGGGISEHGAIALGGAIGPIAPALSPATGGDYTLTGGFWSAFPGQPQATRPVLTIQPLGDGKHVRLSWPIALNGFNLEYCTDPTSGDWLPEVTAVVDTLTEHTVTVESGPGTRCFRLRSK